MKKKKGRAPMKTGRRMQYGEETKVMRVPISLEHKCREWIKEQMKMKTIIILGALVSFPAYACNLDKTNAGIMANYAKINGWCDAPKAKLKPGEIAIEWEYDENGECTIQKARVGK